MESSELDAEISVPVVLVSRDSLYVIVAVLSASVLGCVTVLAYSFTNYNSLRQNAEEVRNYIVSRAKVAERKKSGYGGAGSQNMGVSRGGGVLSSEAAKDKLAEVARQEAPSAENRDTDLRAGSVGLAVPAAASVEETMSSTAAANTSSNATANGFAEVA